MKFFIRILAILAIAGSAYAADPVSIKVPADEWTKVASSVTAGQVCKDNESPSQYNATYKMAGNPAPTLVTEGIQMFYSGGNCEAISAAAAIDVYIWAVSRDGIVEVSL